MFPISNFILPDNFGKQVSFCATEQNSNDRHDVATNNTLSSLLTTHQQAHVMAMMTGLFQHLAWSPGTTFHHEKGWWYCTVASLPPPWEWPFWFHCHWATVPQHWLHHHFMSVLEMMVGLIQKCSYHINMAPSNQSSILRFQNLCTPPLALINPFFIWGVGNHENKTKNIFHFCFWQAFRNGIKLTILFGIKSHVWMY